MTYLQFHLVFLVPPLLVLALPATRAARRLGPRGPWAILAIPPLALLYTTPWDNYLVATGVWWYGQDRVLGTIGYVPVEEYVFFVLQPLLVGAVFYVLLSRTLRTAGLPPQPGRSRAVRAGGALVGLAGAAAGAWLLGVPGGRYLGLILVWASPVLGLMWAFMGDDIVALARPVAWAVAISTLHFWIADRVAIGAGIWEISGTDTLGVAILGLPLEEAVFFLVTDLLVVFGLVLFLTPGLRRPVDRGSVVGAATDARP